MRTNAEKQELKIANIAWVLIMFSGYAFFVTLVVTLLLFIVFDPITLINTSLENRNAEDLPLLADWYRFVKAAFGGLTVYLFLLLFGSYLLLKKRYWGKILTMVLLALALVFLIFGAAVLLNYRTILVKLPMPFWGLTTGLAVMVLLAGIIIWGLVTMKKTKLRKS